MGYFNKAVSSARPVSTMAYFNQALSSAHPVSTMGYFNNALSSAQPVSTWVTSIKLCPLSNQYSPCGYSHTALEWVQSQDRFSSLYPKGAAPVEFDQRIWSTKLSIFCCLLSEFKFFCKYFQKKVLWKYYDVLPRIFDALMDWNDFVENTKFVQESNYTSILGSSNYLYIKAHHWHLYQAFQVLAEEEKGQKGDWWWEWEEGGEGRET